MSEQLTFVGCDSRPNSPTYPTNSRASNMKEFIPAGDQGVRGSQRDGPSGRGRIPRHASILHFFSSPSSLLLTSSSVHMLSQVSSFQFRISELSSKCPTYFRLASLPHPCQHTPSRKKAANLPRKAQRDNRAVCRQGGEEWEMSPNCSRFRCG